MVLSFNGEAEAEDDFAIIEITRLGVLTDFPDESDGIDFGNVFFEFVGGYGGVCFGGGCWV